LLGCAARARESNFAPSCEGAGSSAWDYAQIGKKLHKWLNMFAGTAHGVGYSATRSRPGRSMLEHKLVTNSRPSRALLK
jgi:hypothetical protein